MLILLQRLLAERLAPAPYRPTPRPPAAVHTERTVDAPISSSPQRPAGQQVTVRTATAYYVYTNSRNRYSRIHEESCPWYQRPRTARQTDNGWWHGPYGRLELAEDSPQNIGAVTPCGHCMP
ncbi:MAG: hypothetical protein OYI31_04310 [Chloroflexota bacterium]|nr:hypothetical protein [Chloroflexota bacterium]MDE2941416.1 hypothetical protein [Chloroflexota bacterium]MDE3267666.1 hypothetical protein [Chloroflexota bacterium]